MMCDGCRADGLAPPPIVTADTNRVGWMERAECTGGRRGLSCPLALRVTAARPARRAAPHGRRLMGCGVRRAGLPSAHPRLSSLVVSGKKEDLSIDLLAQGPKRDGGRWKGDGMPDGMRGTPGLPAPTRVCRV